MNSAAGRPASGAVSFTSLQLIMPSARIAADCASASTISTPGITGSPGKWPVKNGSLMLTFLSVSTRFVAEFQHPIDHQERIAMRQPAQQAGQVGRG